MWLGQVGQNQNAALGFQLQPSNTSDTTPCGCDGLQGENTGPPGPYSARQTGTNVVGKSVVCYRRERHRMVHVLWTEYLKRWKRGSDWGKWFDCHPGHNNVWAWAVAGAHVWVHGSDTAVASVDNTKGWEDRTVQIWTHPSLAGTLEKTDPAPDQLKHSGEKVIQLTWPRLESWPWWSGYRNADTKGV